jgi:hypothetical protein
LFNKKLESCKLANTILLWVRIKPGMLFHKRKIKPRLIKKRENPAETAAGVAEPVNDIF